MNPNPDLMENELMTYLSESWGNRTPISWIRFNAKFQGLSGSSFEFPKSILIPNLRQLEGDWLEYPALQSGRTYPYLLFLDLLVEPFTGKSEVQGHLNRIREIFDLKDLIFSESHAVFKMMTVKSGFLTTDGSKWEQPCSVSFTAIL